MTPAKNIKPGDRIRINGRTVKVTRVRDWGKNARDGESVHIEYAGGNMSGVLCGEYDRDIGKAGTQ